jgi:lysophospholipase L1-like esterase
MRIRRALGRLALLVGSAAIWLGLIDLWMRGRVGASGLTPFRNSAIGALPHELVPGRHTLYKGVDVRINQAGFRGPDIVPLPEGTERIALIGDSVTFGNGCPEEGTLAATLQEELARRRHKAQVLNCGVPAYNAANVLTMLEERVLALQPQRVCYVLVANDVTKIQRKAVIPADATIDTGADFPLGSPLLQFLKNQATALARAMGVKLGGSYVEGVLGQFEQGGGERLGRAIQTMARLCRDRGIEYRVLVYPYLVRPSHNPFRVIEDDAVRRCGELLVPCIPLVDAFEPDEDLTKYWVTFLDAHPNADANRKAATLVAAKLLER